MSSLELRGRRLLLILIVIICAYQCWSIWQILGQAEWNFRSFCSIAKCIAVAGAGLFLWRGEVWLVRIVIGYFLFTGLADLVIAGKLMAAVLRETPQGAGGAVLDVFFRICGVLAAFGLFHVVVGLLLWCLPSVRAYFACQRAGGALVQEV